MQQVLEDVNRELEEAGRLPTFAKVILHVDTPALLARFALAVADVHTLALGRHGPVHRVSG